MRIRLQFVFQTIILTLALLISNTLILTTVLYVFPSQLIHDQSLITAHRTMLQFLLIGQEGTLAQQLPPDEYHHIKDVQQIYKLLPYLTVVLLVATYFILKDKSNDQKRKLIFSTQIFILLFVLIALPLFTTFFDYFHYLLFPQGNWSFPADSILIRLYPEEFWQNTLIYLILLTLVETILFLLAIKRNTKVND